MNARGMQCADRAYAASILPAVIEAILGRQEIHSLRIAAMAISAEC